MVIAVLDCASELPSIQFTLLNDYEFIHDGKLYTMGEFGDVFSEASQKIKEEYKRQYDVALRLRKGVSMKRLQLIKVELVKEKNNIHQIIYSHESMTESSLK